MQINEKKELSQKHISTIISGSFMSNGNPTDGERKLIELVDGIIEDLEKVAIYEITEDSKVQQDFGRRVLSLRKALAMTQSEFADKMKVSVKTVQRWESVGLPLRQAKRLYSLIDVGRQRTTALESTRSRDEAGVEKGSESYRNSFDFVLEREKDARAVWVIRSRTPFYVGNPGSIRDTVIEQMLEKETRYLFLFYDGYESDANDPSRISRYPARDSYWKFKRALLDYEERYKIEAGRLFNLARGWGIRSFTSSAKSQDEQPAKPAEIKLDLENLFNTIHLIRYNDQGWKRFGRGQDVFVELPTLSYTSHGVPSDRKTMAWIELHGGVSDVIYSRWSSLLEDLMDPENMMYTHLERFRDEDALNGWTPGIIPQI